MALVELHQLFHQVRFVPGDNRLKIRSIHLIPGSGSGLGDHRVAGLLDVLEVMFDTIVFKKLRDLLFRCTFCD